MVDSFDQHRGKKRQKKDRLPPGGYYLGGVDEYGAVLPSPLRSEEFKKGHRYRGANGRVLDVKARYAVGANQSVDPEAWAKIVGRSPEQIKEIQIALVQAGILGPKKFTPGASDDGTKKAFAKLLAESNANGMRWGDYLSYRVNLAATPGFDSGGNLGGTQGPAKAPLQVALTSASDIKANVAEQGTNLLGSSLAAGDPQHYVDQTHAQETKAQTDEYNGVATVTKPESIDAQLMREHPTEYGVNKLGPAGQQILAQLESRGSGIQ